MASAAAPLSLFRASSKQAPYVWAIIAGTRNIELGGNLKLISDPNFFIIYNDMQ